MAGVNVAYRVEVRAGTSAVWRPIGYRETYEAATWLADTHWSLAQRGQLTGIRVIDQHREVVGAEPIVYSVEQRAGAQV